MDQLYLQSQPLSMPPTLVGRREVRILLCESHAMFRQGLKKLLESEAGFRVIGEAASGADAICHALATRPDVVITELDLHDLDGLSVAQAILQENPATKVIVVTAFLEMRHLHKAAEAGVKAFIPKLADVRQLIETIKRTISGERLLEPTLPAAMARGVMDVETNGEQAGLSAREKGILEQLANGASNQEIAFFLGVSEKTVRNRLSVIYGKLNVHNRTQAAVYAVKKGIAAT